MTRRAWFLYLLCGLAATAAYLTVPGLTESGQLFNLIGVSAAVAILVGIRLHRPPNPRPWYLLALGQGLFVAGDVVAYNYPTFFGTEVPFPSAADVLYLAVYPAIVAGLFLLVRSRTTGRDRTSLIDTTILLVVAATLSWVFLMAPYAKDASLSTSLKLTSIAYPLMDLAVLGIMVRLAVGSGRREAAFRLLTLGTIALLVTDAVFGWLLLNTDFQTGGPLDLGWALFYLLLGASALHPSMRRLADSTGDAPTYRQRLAVLAAAALVVPAIQTWASLTGHTGDSALLGVGSAVMFVLVLVRMRRLMVDLDQHERTEQRLFETREQYRTLIEGLPAVVYSAELGPTGKWLYVSPRSEAVFGWPADVWRDQPLLWEHNVHPDDLGRVMAQIKECAETGTRFLAEYRFTTGDGRERWIRDEAEIVKATRPDVADQIRGVLYDVTEQKLAEERLLDALEREQAAGRHLRELDEMKNSILNAVSHELRTPLTSILGMSRTLQEQREALSEADAHLFIDRIGVNADRLNRLIADLLDLDRLSRGIIEPNRQPIDLGRVVDALLAEVPLEDHPLSVDVDAVSANLDAAQFERIVVNLVSNAARYSSPGTPIDLRIDAADDGVTIVVEDRGPGVPDHLKELIFEPFRQGDQVVTHSPGVGIGLSLVAKFTALHGGRAWVEDRPGGGASFRAFLAFGRVPSPAGAAVSTPLQTAAVT